MNRRGFFKILASVVITSFTLPKAKPKPKTLWMKGKDGSVIVGEASERWPNYYAVGHGGGGITNEQIRDLIETTLKNLPKPYFVRYEYQLQNDPLICVPLKKNETTTPNRS